MDKVRDAILLQGGAETDQIDDVALDKGDPVYLFLRQNLAQALGIFLEIVNPHAVVARQQVARDPTADAPVAAGEQDVHVQQNRNPAVDRRSRSGFRLWVRLPN